MTRTAEHLIALGEAWQLWRWVCVRGTGFAARQLSDLASAELAELVDRQLDDEDVVATRRELVVAACRDASLRGGRDERSVSQALKRLRQLQVPEPIADPTAEAARLQLVDAVARLDAHAKLVDEHYRRAAHASSQALRHVGQDDRFQQALLWQNRQVVHTTLDAMLRQPDGATSSKERRYELVIATYLQRYCVKNDTIGFFGPVGWGRLVDGSGHVTQRPGPSLTASGGVYFEYWAIDALATKLASDPELRPFLIPRRLPRFRVDGTLLHYPIGRQAELPAELALVAAACDGAVTARELARDLVTAPGSKLADEAEVFGVLDELVESKIIHWTLEIPTSGPVFDQQLRALLARVEDERVRRHAEAVLDELDGLRQRVARARDAAELDAALGALDAAFTQATDASSTRGHGQTYAGRTPLYSDYRRDVEIEIGRPVLANLAPALEPLLYSARWFTYEIATRYRRAFAAIYRRLRSPGEPTVELARFWHEAIALFPGVGVPGAIVTDVRDELHRRWLSILAIDPSERVVRRDAASIAAAVRARFAAPGPGWPSARYHSPDVMIAAAGPDALARGDYRLILGELHTGFNTLTIPFLMRQHPCAADLVAARNADLDRTCIAPVWSKAVTRADYYSPSPDDLDLENAETRSPRPRTHVVATSELVIEERDGYLEVRTRDERRRFDVIAFVEHHLIAESFAQFSPMASAPWTPRVEISDVAISRATWRFTPAELAWAKLEDRAARFVAARRWARAHGMPRWMFVRTHEEVKPVYVDFDSPVYVETLAKLLRSASSASLSEMLPTMDDAWLIDAEGSTYTSELRIAALDPESWRPERVDQDR